ncbi:MAG: pyridoxal phosphate-dependent aminotransferase [Peptococcaceae bacterium]|nr:pyridoxal phosphate-dependent aminotransferase [Peptococcaceae bacterium]
MNISRKIAASLEGASFIRKMFEEGERLRAIFGADRVYDFSLGNPSEEPPAAIHAELQKLALSPIPGMHRYMPNAGYQETRAAVARVLAREASLPVEADHVVMTCGAGGALNVALKAILDPGDEVIVITPYFMEYRFYVDNHGGVIREVPAGDNFLPDLDALAEAVNQRTRALILNSPNNPTGVVYPAAVFDGLQELLADREKKFDRMIYVIADEPYAKLVYDGVTVPPVMRHIKNALVATSHSKDLGLPGERIGYLAASPRIDSVDLLMQALIFTNRTLGFVNAPALMQRLVAPLEGLPIDVAPYREKRDILYNHLIALGYRMVKPQGAFYLFPRSPIPDDLAFVDLARKHNILVVPGRGFGRPGYFRLSYSVPLPTVQGSLPAFDALAEDLAEHPQRRVW